MTELTKDDVKEAVREALAEKFELTLGVDCRDPDSRLEVRKDMDFLRTLRKATHRGGERLFWWIFGLAGTSILAFFWPEINKHLGK